MTTKAKTTAKAPKKSAVNEKPVTEKAKVSTASRRAVKRERVAMVKPAPSAPTLAPVAKPVEPMKVETAKVETKKAEPLKLEAKLAEPMIDRTQLDLMIRRAAYQRAQARQFRGGSPAQDWFAAEAAVKAELNARGVQLPN
ncbi:MAG: DUF2934 domain-containing protein [Myxococcaceae bacterium]